MILEPTPGFVRWGLLSWARTLLKFAKPASLSAPQAKKADVDTLMKRRVYCLDRKTPKDTKLTQMIPSWLRRFSPRFLQESTVDTGLDDEAAV